MSRAVDINGRGVRVEGRGVGVGSAIPDSVVLEPESGDLTHFSGTTGNYSIVSSPTLHDGPNVLQGDYLAGMYSTSGLDAYPQVGYRHKIWVEGTENANPMVRFGVQDSSNYYAISFDEASNELRIKKDGSRQNTTSVTINQDTTYIFDWDWRSASPNIEVRLFDSGDDPATSTPSATLSYDDTEYTNGGVGFQVGRGTGNDSSPTAYFEDYWRAEPL